MSVLCCRLPSFGGVWNYGARSKSKYVIYACKIFHPCLYLYRNLNTVSSLVLSPGSNDLTGTFSRVNDSWVVVLLNLDVLLPANLSYTH